MSNLFFCVWMIPVLLHIADCGKFELITTSNEIIAEAGENITLPCYIKSSISAENMIVEWFRNDRLVHRYTEGRDDYENQDPTFRNRKSLYKNELVTGKVSLDLRMVKGTDEGNYTCSVTSPTTKLKDDLNIKVIVKAVGSQPVVSIEGHREAGMGLVCETQGWNPEPEMVWQDSDGFSLPADPPETTRDTEGLYTLRLRAIVQKTGSNLFNCTVKHKYMERDITAMIHVPDELFYQNHTWKWVLALVFSVILSAAAAAAAGYFCFRLKRQKEQKTLSKQLDLVNTREYQDFGVVRRHAVDVILDPDTAHPNLILSADGKQVSYGERQDCLDIKERFDEHPYVLGKESFSSGRFYYEVQVNNKTKWRLGVATKSCKKKGCFDMRPIHGYWTISLRKDGKYQALAKTDVHLHLSQKPQKVGVFVDYENSTVSFYNVEAKIHIFSFTNCCFEEKLYPIFSPNFKGDSGENSAPLVICPVVSDKPESLHLSESQTHESDSDQQPLLNQGHHFESQTHESDSAHQPLLNQGHQSESPTDESDSAHQSLLNPDQSLQNQDHQSESCEEINESVSLLENSASYKV